MGEVKKEKLTKNEYAIEHATDKYKECKHEWCDLERIIAQYKASIGTIKPARFEFCRKCRIVRIGGELY